MVQQTLDATKNFIFDVRPMVLDDLGLVPTLRRATRDRGRRAHVPVEFESLGGDRRLPVDIESTVFRILDEALAAYLTVNPERVALRLDWGEELDGASLGLADAGLRRRRAAAGRADREERPRRDQADDPGPPRRPRRRRSRPRRRRRSWRCPPRPRRDVQERAGSIGARVEIDEGGSELHLVVALPPEVDEGSAA